VISNGDFSKMPRVYQVVSRAGLEPATYGDVSRKSLLFLLIFSLSDVYLSVFIRFEALGGLLCDGRKRQATCISSNLGPLSFRGMRLIKSLALTLS